MLAIRNISIMMWILYIDRKQYWKWTINSGANAHVKQTVSENSDRLDSWASSDIGEEMSQFSSHSPYSVSGVSCFTVWQFLLLHVFVVFETWHRNDEDLGGGGGHSSPVYLVFGVVYWSRPPRVLRRFTALLFFLSLLKPSVFPILTPCLLYQCHKNNSPNLRSSSSLNLYLLIQPLE